MPATPIRPVRCRRCTSRSSELPSPRPPPTITASSIAISPAARWRRKASMAPDADARKSAQRADPFAPLTSEHLSVSDGHDIYVESVGRVGGVAAVYLHGGPGTGCQPDHPRLFDPGLYEDFLRVLPGEERARPIEAYFRRILDADPAVHGPAARAWGQTEGILSEHAPKRSRLDLPALASSRASPATPFMEAHYFANNSFMQPDQLINEAGKLAGIPGIIVQGRYDLLCPPATSHALGAVWREAEIRD